MLPLEFTIHGIPVSSQARRRARIREWRDSVATAARQMTDGRPPISIEVAIEITYYYDGDTPDIDNIIKPIQDALIGLVYGDDCQVIETRARKSRLDGSFRIVGASAVLLAAFSAGKPFVHVRVIEAEVHSDLRQ